MKRALTLASLAGFAALVMAARPGNEQQLIQQLNGQPSRWTMPDGGRSGVFTVFDGGALNNLACVNISGATNSAGQAVSANVILLVALGPANVCVRPSVFSPLWDGGCNTIPWDENYGVPVPAGVPQYITPDSAARSLCAVGDAGFLAVPLWTVQ